MAEVINSSFIPKKEFKKNSGSSKGPRINILFLISLVIFLSTIIASVAVYLWKVSLEKELKIKRETFASRSEDYGIETIRKFSQLDSRIKAADELLEKHYNILPIFTYLEKNTLVDTTLTEFALTETDSEIKITAKGEAPDLTDLQLQSRGYAKNPNISNLILSNITKSKEGYSVFDLEFTIDKKFLTDRTFLIQN